MYPEVFFQAPPAININDESYAKFIRDYFHPQTGYFEKNPKALNFLYHNFYKEEYCGYRQDDDKNPLKNIVYHLREAANRGSVTAAYFCAKASVKHDSAKMSGLIELIRDYMNFLEMAVRGFLQFKEMNVRPSYTDQFYASIAYLELGRVNFNGEIVLTPMRHDLCESPADPIVKLYNSDDQNYATDYFEKSFQLEKEIRMDDRVAYRFTVPFLVELYYPGNPDMLTDLRADLVLRSYPSDIVEKVPVIESSICSIL